MTHYSECFEHDLALIVRKGQSRKQAARLALQAPQAEVLWFAQLASTVRLHHQKLPIAIRCRKHSALLFRKRLQHDLGSESSWPCAPITAPAVIASRLLQGLRKLFPGAPSALTMHFSRPRMCMPGQQHCNAAGVCVTQPQVTVQVLAGAPSAMQPRQPQWRPSRSRWALQAGNQAVSSRRRS